MPARKMVTHCSECQQPLDNPLDQLMGVCQNPLCRGPYFRKVKFQAQAAAKAARQALIESTYAKWGDAIHELEGQIPGASDELPTIVMAVPSCERAIVPLPDARRQQFIEKLDQLLHDATERLQSQQNLDAMEAEYGYRKHAEVAPAPLPVVNGCTTCRGFCCWQGGTDAFLTADFLAWQLINYPDVGADVLRDRYIARLPSESNEDSCVFHAIDGCQITREMRNNICNVFHCKGLMDVAESFDSGRKSVAVAADEGQVKRVGIMPAHGIRREIEVQSNVDANLEVEPS